MQFKKSNLKFGKLYITDPKEKVEIILHHPAAYEATPEDIHRWHLERGWSGAGYHVYVRKNGDVYILRPINTTGAHCEGHNRKGIGVSFEGNFSDWNPKIKIDKEMNPIQFKAGVQTLAYLCREYNIPITSIAPHSKYDNKDCPGKYFPLQRMLDEVKWCLEGKSSSLDKSLKVLIEKEIILNQGYWYENAVEGKTCDGKYVGILIENMANKLRGEYL